MTGLSYAPNGAHLAVGLVSGEVQVFDIESNSCVFTLQPHHEVGSHSPSYNSGHHTLYSFPPVSSCSICTGLLRGWSAAGSWPQEWTDTDMERFVETMDIEIHSEEYFSLQLTQDLKTCSISFATFYVHWISLCVSFTIIR